MPDFQTVVVRAPYEADIVLGRRRQRVRVDEAFEIPIPSLSRSDVQRAAVAKAPHADNPDLWTEFVGVGGRLFRPYLDLLKTRFWTTDRCRQDPPTMDFAERWGSGVARAAMLGSPFRPSYVDVPDAYRRQARRRAPAALEEARARTTRIAQAGLVFVDGVLFQETRTPGYGAGANGAMGVCLPDLTEAPPVTLIDPRIPLNTIDEATWDDYRRQGTIEVVDASLLPRTTERDALGCFAVHLCQDLAERGFKDFDRAFSTELLCCVNAIEAALRDGTPLEPCYAAVERIADWDLAADRMDGFDDDMPARMQEPKLTAKVFMDLRRALPPPSVEPSPIDEADADGISGAFKP
jgi:hypothetical protein